MIKVFNQNNLKEVLNKKPIICYYSENGACGPSGLFFVVFSDRTCYAYSTYYEKSDFNLIHDILEYVPELTSLVRVEEELNFKRERYKNEYELVYLGLGNYGLLKNDFVGENEGQFDFTRFMEIAQENVDGNMKEIWKMVKEEING